MKGGAIQRWLYASAAPMTIEARCDEQAVSVSLGVAVPAALLPAKLLALADGLYKQYKVARSVCDVVALLREDADAALLAELEAMLVSDADGGTELVQAVKSVASQAAKRVSAWDRTPFVFEIEDERQRWAKYTRRAGREGDGAYPTDDELNAAFDVIEGLPNAIDALERKYAEWARSAGARIRQADVPQSADVGARLDLGTRDTGGLTLD